MDNRVAILTYHSLDESGSVISTPPRVFREQMRLLRDWGYRGISLSELLDDWESELSSARRSVVITFDDAYCNVMDCAVPILAELDFRATIFAVANYCGTTNDWPSQPANTPRLTTLSFAALRELSDSGIEIGAHTLTHPRLPSVDSKTVEYEIVRGRELVADQIGRPVTVFAYPYGLADRRHRDIAAQHFRASCGTTLRMARRSDQWHYLPRIDMYYFRKLSVFRLFPSMYGRLYLRFCNIGRAFRNSILFA